MVWSACVRNMKTDGIAMVKGMMRIRDSRVRLMRNGMNRLNLTEYVCCASLLRVVKSIQNECPYANAKVCWMEHE